METLRSLTIHARNAYGIRNMDAKLDFTGGRRGIAVYAPNGTCKSSLRKSLEDFSNNKQPCDLFNPTAESSFSVIADPPDALDSSRIRCFGGTRTFSMSQLCQSNLLLSSSIQEELLKPLRDHETHRKELIEQVKRHISPRSKRTALKIEHAICKHGNSNDLSSALESLIAEAQATVIPSSIPSAPVSTVLGAAVRECLEKEGVAESVREYAETLDHLFAESGLFRGLFTYSTAQALLKQLKSSGFFDASHQLDLLDTKTNERITCASCDDFERLINRELQEAAGNEEAQARFSHIDGIVGGTQKAKVFKGVLRDHPELISYMHDLDSLEKLYYLSAALALESEIAEFTEEDREQKRNQKALRKRADDERTDWDKALEVFEARFSVPCKLVVTNKLDTLVRAEVPHISFVYEDHTIEESVLFDGLSEGERKAMLVLNMIFEINRARESPGNLLLVFDDIVDSFDYANKHAFLEYLRDIALGSELAINSSNESADQADVYLLVLTHNYDFFRLLNGRVRTCFPTKSCYAAESNSRNVQISAQCWGFEKNLISRWRNQLKTPAIRIASIPFVRELASMRGTAGSTEYEKLSNILHGREDAQMYRFADISPLFEEQIGCDALSDDYSLVLETIKTECDNLAADESRTMNLEEKITLSIGVRIQVERYLRRRAKEANVEPDQIKMLGRLVDKFKANSQIEPYYRQNQMVIDQAVLATAEFIHLNSFAYESLIDTGSSRLRKLYQDAALLNA